MATDVGTAYSPSTSDIATCCSAAVSSGRRSARDDSQSEGQTNDIVCTCELRTPGQARRSRRAGSAERQRRCCTREYPRALEACIRTIDDGVDELHADHTPAVRCLVEIGLPAVVPLLDVLLAPGQLTRLHAQRAIEKITLALPEFQAPDRRAREDSWRAWWTGNGIRLRCSAGPETGSRSAAANVGRFSPVGSVP